MGCQSDSSGDSAKDTSQESESILGQVTAIEDGTITLALGERSENEKMQPPANKEDDGGNWEAPPDGEDGGTPPDTENGGTPPGGEHGGTPPDAENRGTPPGGEDGGTPPDSGNGLPGELDLRVRKPPLLQMIPCLLFWTPEEKPLRVPSMTSL